SFYGELDCSGSVRGSISERTVEAGQTESLPVTFSGENTDSGTIEENCEITIRDRKSDETDTCNFGVNVDYVEDRVCEPDSKICTYGDKLKVCNSDGTSSEIIQCEKECVMEDGVGTCIDEDDDDGEKVEGTCETDEDCAFYKKCVTKSETHKDWYNYVGIGEPTVVENNQCVTEGWVYAAIGGIVIIALGGIALVLNMQKK
ncbi:MAG: hypothetical protein ACOCRO_09770, partial [Halanaerobiales bacterium]